MSCGHGPLYPSANSVLFTQILIIVVLREMESFGKFGKIKVIIEMVNANIRIAQIIESVI